LLVPHPRRKLDSLKAEYAARNPSADTLENRHVATIMGTAPQQVAGWFHREFDKTGTDSDIPAAGLGRLVAWLQSPSPVRDFPDHTFGNLGIRIEVDWMVLPWADFEARRAAAGSPLVVAHPRSIFGSQVSDPSFLTFNSLQVQGALSPDDSTEPRKAKFPFDPGTPPKYVEACLLRVEMPFHGRLTVVGAEADRHGRWKFFSFDPFLNIERRAMERGWTLPYQRRDPIPLYGPAGDCLIVGIATKAELRLPWEARPIEGQGVRRVDVEDLRDISAQLKGRNPAAYRVGLLEYEMVPDAIGPARR
jgi:hypothetical protein